jgi:hypothetical protein
MSVKLRPILKPLWVFERQVGTVAPAPSEPLRVAEDGASAGCWVIVRTCPCNYYCLKLVICSLLMDCGEGLNLLGIWRMHSLPMRISKRVG